MALDDVSPQAGSYSPDNGPSGGPSGQNPAMARYFPLKAKPELLVKPDLFTLYFGFFGTSNWKRAIAHALTERVDYMWTLTARGPTQEELDAFTTHSSRSLYYSRIGVPLSSFLGAAYLYNRERKVNGPSGEVMNPRQIFESLRAQATLDKTAFRSMLARNAFKMLFFATTGAIVSTFAGIYTAAKGVLGDPRLRQFIKDANAQNPEDIRKRKISSQRWRSRRLRGEEVELDRQFEEELSGGGGYDKAGDYDPYSYDNSVSASASTESYADVSQSTQQYGIADQTRSAPDTSRRSQRYGWPPAPQGMGQEQPTSGSDLFFSGGDDDDASPTAPEYRRTNADGTPAGSAWEHVRRQSGIPGSQQASGGSPRMQRWGQLRGSPESSDNSPSNDEDQGREKERAQAYFDRLLEAERNAANNDGPSPGRGWGS